VAAYYSSIPKGKTIDLKTRGNFFKRIKIRVKSPQLVMLMAIATLSHKQQHLSTLITY
jgi:hypothetical protein